VLRGRGARTYPVQWGSDKKEKGRPRCAIIFLSKRKERLLPG